jgi:hypothetical protein
MDKSIDLGREVLKWIAVITMTIDHIGAILLTEFNVLRIIGRLSFPLFSYMLVLGLESTRSVRNYFVRLFLFAFISQVPFYRALEVQPVEHLNIFFTLSLGLVFIHFHRKNPLLTLVPLLASTVLPLDYGIYGIISIGCMHLLRNDTKLGIASLFLLNLLFLPFSLIQFLSVLALPIILSYEKGYLGTARRFRGKTTYPVWKKYFFYLYYPLHLMVFYAIKVVPIPILPLL